MVNYGISCEDSDDKPDDKERNIIDQYDYDTRMAYAKTDEQLGTSRESTASKRQIWSFSKAVLL